MLSTCACEHSDEHAPFERESRFCFMCQGLLPASAPQFYENDENHQKHGPLTHHSVDTNFYLLYYNFFCQKFCFKDSDIVK